MNPRHLCVALPLGLFARPSFSGAQALTLVLYFALNAQIFYLPMTLIGGWGLTAAEVSLIMLPFGAILTVLALYLGVQLIESYLISPLVQQRAVAMPPGLLIASQVILGVLAGLVGVAVATPLAVVAIILVQMLYVEDVLGDDVEVMGGGEDGR